MSSPCAAASVPSAFATLPEERFAPCCFPSGPCLVGAMVDITSEADDDSLSPSRNNGSSANKMYCTNSTCDASRYIHTHCLEQLENQLAHKAKKLISELKLTGSVSSMGDKQIRQNVWNLKPDLEQLYSSLGCQCGKGHVTRDPAVAQEEVTEPFQIVSSGGKRGGSGTKKKGAVNFSSPRGANPKSQTNQAQPKQISRIRNSLSASDMSSTAASAAMGYHHPHHHAPGANTASSSPGTTAVAAHSPDSMSPRSGGSNSHLSSSSKWGLGAGSHSSPPTTARLGRRSDFVSLQTALEPYRYNIYHVKLEEELPSDEYREAFIQTLRSRSLNTMCCLICSKRLLVYDRYPLIDGCVFVSPVRHQQDERSLPFNMSNNKHQFMSSVCVKCLQGSNVVCLCCHCGREWIGVAFQIGVVYPFDIFAPSICCSERSKCSHCEKQLVSSTRPPPQRYAEFSLSFSCPSCQQVDFHFVKPISRLFKIQNSNLSY